MRTTLALFVAMMIAAPVAFTGCDRTATTETTHTESGPDGATVSKETKTTDMNTGNTTVTKEKKEIDTK
jgi:hypothetical protein